MEIEGKRVICDRCKAETFIRRTGTKETDGGFTSWDTFEDLPSGWERLVFEKLKFTHLCPECNSKLTKILNDFSRNEGGNE